jgi:hypothetical protein
MSMESTKESSDVLRFDAAESVSGTTTPTCTSCASAIQRMYHEVNGQVICAPCRGKLEAFARGDGSGTLRFVRALLFGLVGAAIGAGIYYAILALTGYEIGLVAIVVGWLVGRGVSMGANARGGALYQALAIVLTYIAIVSTYIPLAIKEGVNLPPVVMFITALMLPFLSGIQNIIGIAIIGFALYQAWSMNKRLAINLTGPYEVKAAPAAPARA